MHYIHAKAREAQEQYIAELGIAADANSDSGLSAGAVKLPITCKCCRMRERAGVTQW